MVIFKCKMCGGDLDIQGSNTVCECEYCGTRQTVPGADNEKKVNLFNRANRLRYNCEFDKAAGVYESIAAEFPEEAEAYWGLCLCKYGIEYVDDPATAKKIPTCHRTSYDSIFQDSNFDLACEYADSVARQIYRAEAKEIERLQKEILNIVKNEEPFDIFICYKETAPDGQRTKDSVLAQDIYDALTGKGYKVFFARITLEDKLGRDYEPYIFSALNSAKVMLAIGTDYEYFNAVWVKNEWSRFLALMGKDKNKTIIPCYCDIDADDMPEELRRLQGQDMGKVGFIQDLVRGIEKIIPLTSSESQRVVIQQQTSGNPTVDSLVKRAMLFLEDGNFTKADEYAEKVLDADPENGYAYLVKLCVEHSTRNPDELAKLAVPLDTFANFQKAVKYGNDTLRNHLYEINEKSLEEKRAKEAEIAASKEAERQAEILRQEAERTEKIKQLTKEAYHCIENGTWSRAHKCFSEVLTIDPENGKAHPGVFQAKYQVKSIKNISKEDTKRLITNGSLPNDPVLHKAIQFSDDKSRSVLKELQAKALKYPEDDKRRKDILIDVYHSSVDEVEKTYYETNKERDAAEEKYKKAVDSFSNIDTSMPKIYAIIALIFALLWPIGGSVFINHLNNNDSGLDIMGGIWGCIVLGIVTGFIPAAITLGIFLSIFDKINDAKNARIKKSIEQQRAPLEKKLNEELNRIRTKMAEVNEKKICLWCGSIMNVNENQCVKCGSHFTISFGEAADLEEDEFVKTISDVSVLPPNHDYLKNNSRVLLSKEPNSD